MGIVLVAGLVFFPLKAGVWWFGGKSVPELVDAVKRTWYQVMVLLYMPLCAGAFSLFGCRKDVTGRWVLNAAPWRSCYTSTWWSLFAFGLFGVVGYGFGLPAAVVGILYRARRDLDELSFVLRYGFLVGRFRSTGWYYEALIMCRKLGVVICMTFFFSELSKAYSAVWVLVGSLVHLIILQPYRAMFHNVLAVVVLSAVTLVLHAGSFQNKGMRTFGVITGIVVNLAAIVVGNIVDVIRIKKKEADVEENEFFDAGMTSDSDLSTDFGADLGTASTMSQCTTFDYASPPPPSTMETLAISGGGGPAFTASSGLDSAPPPMPLHHQQQSVGI